MHVGQTAFLELDRVDVGDRFAEDSVFVDIFDDGLLFHVEDPGAEIGTIGGSLAWKKFLCDLWPVWVAGDGDEEVDFLVVTGQGKCILQTLLHVSRTTGV